ncbi:hypothetical protein PP182_03240 [Maribacter sp. PR1]|uniref:DUF4468 domain-containing protein n=1 Tax=Maribacter cobaltidurans TaxID=1178778 RepID=A0ABU7IQ35_9FLAO|nr:MULTISPECIES: hypothetical protein [Maribacter]MDC6387680.1 hypothetical protein [Maribacter sp. PR1]MEE1975069.1 hypothetical protein [Maribacter cobaltidurans]
MKYKFLLFLFLSASLSYGQYSWTNGQLVLKNGEILVGQIKLPMISKNLIAFNGKEKVKYRKKRKSKINKFDETQVKSVIFRRSDSEIAYFEYIPISDNKKGLFQVITSGKATLYARSVSVTSASGPAGGFQVYSFNNFNEFYVIREGEELASPMITARLSRSFKKRAMDYFSDCSKLVAKLESKSYNKEDIKKVVEEYNNCL